MSRPLAAKGGGASPSLFSTPGSLAQFAREIVDAFGGMRFNCDRPVENLRQWPWSAGAEAQLSISSPPSPASRSSPSVADATSLGGGGERDRVQQLYEEHSSSLVRQLTRKTGCREIARDLANETFLRLLRMAPGNLGRIQQPEAFLRHVSTNLLRDWGRARALRDRSQPTLELAFDEQFDQVTALESRDTLRRLEDAMSKLKPRTRAIFLAHRIHGFSYAEIAERTGLSVKGVEKQMGKAIAKIDRLLDRG